MPLPRHFSPTDDTPAISAIDWADAEDALLDDVSRYTDWLNDECAKAGIIVMPVLPREPGALQLVVEGMTVPQLVRLSLELISVHRHLAASELRLRWVASLQGEVALRAGRAAERRAEDEASAAVAL